MKIIRILALISALFVTIEVFSQDTTSVAPAIDKVSLGLGMGLDYGGFGANIMVCPSQNVGIFGGLGYAFAGAGFNAGIKLRAVPKTSMKKTSAFGILMYGYNAAIAVTGASQYNKFFYGPTVGVGIDYRANPVAKGYWSMALLVPIRSSEVNDYIDDLKNNQGVEFKNGLIPIAISIGYRFSLN